MQKNHHGFAPGNELPGLLTALMAAGCGMEYYVYLSAVDFPLGAARAVPFLWLALAVMSLVLATRVARKSYLSYAVIALSIPSIVLAAVFATAAIFGD